MIKDIKYNGYTAQPSDYASPDGDLALSLNLISEDGALHPLPMPQNLNATPIGARPVFIHNMPAFPSPHYICKDTDDGENSYDTFYWCVLDAVGNPSLKPLGTVPGAFISVTAVGNTLVFLTTEGMYYFLWKEDYVPRVDPGVTAPNPAPGYAPLGNHLPELNAEFSLEASVYSSQEFTLTYNSVDTATIHIKAFDDDNRAKLTEQVLAQVNKFIADVQNGDHNGATADGRFIMPFLVRYAYRLFDGSLTMHSAPVLMLAATGVTPAVCSWEAGVTSCKAQVQTLAHALSMRVYDADVLRDWKDIIASVDVFISAPFYTYDQNGRCAGLNGGDQSDVFACCRWESADYTSLTLRETGLMHSLYTVKLPERDIEDVYRDIRDCAQFYLLRSIDVADVSLSNSLPLKHDYMRSIRSRELMTDDFDSHDTILPRYAFPYNSRLSIADIARRPFTGFTPAACLGQQFGAQHYVDVYVHLRRNGREAVFKFPGRSSEAPTRALHSLYFYYPDRNAYKVTLVFRSAAPGVDSFSRILHLTPHETLNGAVYFNGWKNIDADKTWSTTEAPSGTVPAVTSPDDFLTPLYNRVYTSEVNNPFFFPVTGITSVGAGTILGICSAARPLSQGQFGQFPLYAFTTEGVWALQVSDTGTFTARQPITRDVVLDGTHPLQMDSAVLFATDRGIMLISGSQTQCVSDVINSQSPFDVSQLPGISKLHAMLGHNADSCIPTAPLLEYVAGGGMLYDYVHQRVIVYNPKYTYAYAFSLKSQQWGMMYSAIEAGINSYPDAIAVSHDGDLLDYSTIEGKATKGLLVTRPLKLDMPDILKTVDTVIQRGHFRRGTVQSVLYGSRDLFNWHIVWSSKDHYLRGFRGSPYKYFRLACVTSLADGESVFGATVQFAPRQVNQPR